MSIEKQSISSISSSMIMMKNVNESNYESIDITMMGQKTCDNTISTLNNLSICLDGNIKEDIIKYSNDTNVNLLQFQQYSQNLDSVIEEEQGIDEECIRNISKIRQISEEDKNQSILQGNSQEKTLNLIQDLPIKLNNNFLKINQNQNNPNLDQQQNCMMKTIQISQSSNVQIKKKQYSKQIFPQRVNIRRKLNTMVEQTPPVQQNSTIGQNAPINQKEEKPARKISEQKISCKICLDEEGPFLTPCKCSGSCSQVHEKCLIDWILQQQKNKRKIRSIDGNSEKTQFQTQLPEAECEICQYNYKYQTIYSQQFSLECLTKCDQSTQSFSTGLIGSLLSCFMIFLIVVMFTNSPFATSGNKQQDKSSQQTNENQKSYQPEKQEQANSDYDDEQDSNQKLQYTFLALSFVILTLFLIIAIKCCRKALYQKRIIAWKILGYGQEVKSQAIEFKKNKIGPNPQINQTTLNIVGNDIRVVQQTQVRSQTSRILNTSQALRVLHNNTIPMVQPENQQSRVVVIQQALRASRF